MSPASGDAARGFPGRDRETSGYMYFKEPAMSDAVTPTGKDDGPLTAPSPSGAEPSGAPSVTAGPASGTLGATAGAEGAASVAAGAAGAGGSRHGDTVAEAMAASEAAQRADDARRPDRCERVFRALAHAGPLFLLLVLAAQVWPDFWHAARGDALYCPAEARNIEAFFLSMAQSAWLTPGADGVAHWPFFIWFLGMLAPLPVMLAGSTDLLFPLAGALGAALALLAVWGLARAAGFGFALLVAFIVWMSTKAVSRMTAIVLGAKVITFFLTFGSLLGHVQPATLFNVAESNASYAPYLLMTLPFCLASFGYHGNVPSLMKYYGKDPKTIVKCLVYGTLMALALYTIWLLATMGNIPRPEFIGIAEKGGNIDVLVQALSGVLNSRSLDLLLVVFSNFAVASSFLGVTLGLFDYLADLFGFDDSALGRLKTALLTFAPPVVGGLLFPNGFLYAIGYAGLAATIWAAIVPALLARASRKRFGSPKFRVWGGKPMITLILVFGVGNALVHILSSFNLLPVYQ